jgi:hypothetical protein
MAFMKFPIVRLDNIENFITDLNRGKLLEEDKRHFRHQLCESYVRSFMILMQNEADLKRVKRGQLL